MVSAAGIDPQQEKIQSIQDWPVLKCVCDVRAFFGLASYYRKSVQNFASIAEPLSALTKNGVRFSWSPEAQQAFERLKRVLAETVTLAYPQPNQTFILDTDASDVAVGAILSTMVDGVERPIAFFLPSNELRSTKLLSDSAGAACGHRRPPALPPLLSRGHSNFAYSPLLAQIIANFQAPRGHLGSMD